MKRFFSLISIIVCILYFGTNKNFAQNHQKPREIIIVKFSIPDGGSFKLEVPVNLASKNFNGVGGAGGIGIGAGCGGCSQAEIDKRNNSYAEESRKHSYYYGANAQRINKNKANLNFVISIGGGRCKTQKDFIVYRNRQIKTQLDCGINLTAYYSFEDKREN